MSCSKKEIAKIFSLSIRTIEFHRQNIRKKLGLKHKKSSDYLRSYLGKYYYDSTPTLSRFIAGQSLFG
jgi:DNA-binding NarL/FixJ family response regulator